MSSGLAISGVTAVLQYSLYNLYTSAGFPYLPVVVSCLAPDQIQNTIVGKPDVENQVNLFLHQVTHNAAWRNVELPSLAADGHTVLSNPPLALDLHYLLTVYGSQYWQAEALLGYAVMMLHDNPVLQRNDITKVLNALNSSDPFPTNPLTTSMLLNTGIADQIELLKIVPETLKREEMAWLWTALKADYRPTFPFQVSVVLMQQPQPMSFPAPVIHRKVKAEPIQPTAILAVTPPNHQAVALATDTITVTGEFLRGISQVQLTSSRYGSHVVLIASGTNTSFTFVPDAGATHPAGIYDVVAPFTDTGGTVLRTTNSLPLAIAATLQSQVANVTTISVAGTILKQVSVSVGPGPSILESQTVALALSSPDGSFSMSAPMQPLPSGTSSTLTPSFHFPANLPSGQLLASIQVDGVASPVQVNWTAHPPVFTGPMVTIP